MVSRRTHRHESDGVGIVAQMLECGEPATRRMEGRLPGRRHHPRVVIEGPTAGPADLLDEIDVLGGVHLDEGGRVGSPGRHLLDGETGPMHAGDGRGDPFGPLRMTPPGVVVQRRGTGDEKSLHGTVILPAPDSWCFTASNVGSTHGGLSVALAETPFKMTMRGTWPGPLTLRRNWARAEARPWNDNNTDASLRLVRGGGGFLAACAEQLFTMGAPSVSLLPFLPTPGVHGWMPASSRRSISHSCVWNSTSSPRVRTTSW